MGGLFLGMLFSFVPLELVFITGVVWLPIYIFLEWRGYRKRNSVKPLLQRTALATSFVLICIYAPTKYMNTEIDLKGIGKVKLGEFYKLENRELTYFRFPEELASKEITFPHQVMQLKDVIELVERETGLTHALGYCGTGCTIINGCGPIGAIHFGKESNSG
ncbi:hypothetical protein CWB98_19985 [Pseudoalteromonas rubra]|uniref:Uncharacterized protein n=2 Tax=Pseudoalteromonas rubra TaxID=43658 RepID=A0A5S3WWG5_9GAMM|nr:hypothetical protein CWB98_19985 [Pseudoalteromonas rubra]